jgi:hypothetical protein
MGSDVSSIVPGVDAYLADIEAKAHEARGEDLMESARREFFEEESHMDDSRSNRPLR